MYDANISLCKMTVLYDMRLHKTEDVIMRKHELELKRIVNHYFKLLENMILTKTLKNFFYPKLVCLSHPNASQNKTPV